jgi:hypothetical protein
MDENYLVDQIKKLDGTKEKRIKTNNTCASCKQSIYTDLLRDYTGDEGFEFNNPNAKAECGCGESFTV